MVQFSRDLMLVIITTSEVVAGISAGFMAIFIGQINMLCLFVLLNQVKHIEERGIIGKRIVSIQMDKVQDVICKFGSWAGSLGLETLKSSLLKCMERLALVFCPHPER